MNERRPHEAKKSDTAKREEEILAFWKENDIFGAALRKDSPEGEFVFYDGPPFATGLPHYGHILAGTIKDAIPRYKTMRGFHVPRRWGWDCHGLPVENEVEKELGLKTKKDIESLGIETFNSAARSAVLRYTEDWKRFIPRTGRFVDMENDYRTMDSSYTESIWWSFKKLHSDGLVYKGFKSMHLCPRCETTLSNFEVNQGYKDITDLSVVVKLELKDEPGAHLLVWTTTPWTLPGNMAVAVNKKFTYIKAKKDDTVYIVAKERAAAILGEKHTVLETMPGEDLVGKRYIPPFDYYTGADLHDKENAWQIYDASYVTLEAGTGLVHIAPAFGEEDLYLAQKMHIPVVHHVGVNGAFKPEITDFAGMAVKPKDDKTLGVGHQDADVAVVKNLAHRGLLFSKEKIVHSYPHCWRCDTPLLNYASTSWFLQVTKIKDKLVAENNAIAWVPESVGTYRFGNWLAEARDWAISRSRFWGAPLPVWACEQCDNVSVIGSLEELKKRTKKSGNRYFALRHGEAEHMRTGIYTADPDSKYGLTKDGVEQVSDAASKFPREQPFVIVASPVLRARESAEILAQKLGTPVEDIIFDDRLREINFGEFDGKQKTEYLTFLARPDWYTAVPKGGESLEEVKIRFGQALYEYESRYQNTTVVLVTHAVGFSSLATASEGASGNRLYQLADAANAEPGALMELYFVPLPVNAKFELDLHRPYIDAVVLSCTCGAPLKRIPDVFDCWYESGAMPYAQRHYLGEKKHDFDPEKGVGFPADFIAEGLDQTRGWFYSLLVLNTALFGRAPYRHVIVNGIIRAEDGQKMSKRLKNYPDPMDIISTYGADSLRYYLLSSPVVRGEDINFSERGVDEVSKKIVVRLRNVVSFQQLYVRPERRTLRELRSRAHASENPLDRWIISRLGELLRAVTDGFESYELDSAARPVALFTDDLSAWYVRRSRGRFKDPASEDYQNALATLQLVLIELSKLLAPVMPFFAEYLYRTVRPEDGPISVHLANWPEDIGVDEKILKEMADARAVVSQALELRDKAHIKVRQPLSLLRARALPESTALRAIIADEINVKRLEEDPSLAEEVWLDTELTAILREEGLLRDVVRAVQDMRKQEGLSVGDRPALIVRTDAEGKQFFKKFAAEIASQAGLSALKLETVGKEEGNVPLPFAARFEIQK